MLGKVTLSDTEWAQLMDGQREDSALPACCANISALRDVVGLILRQGGELNVAYAKLFLSRLEVVEGGHDIDHLVALLNMRRQVRDYLEAYERQSA